MDESKLPKLYRLLLPIVADCVIKIDFDPCCKNFSDSLRCYPLDMRRTHVGLKPFFADRRRTVSKFRPFQLLGRSIAVGL
jgi:hypothetical protein